MITNVGQLLGMQPWIDRMQDCAGSGNAVVRFQMPVAVPCQGCHPLALSHAEAVQRVRKALGALVAFAESVTVQVAFHAARDDLAATVVPRGKLDNAGDQQGLAHHLAH